MDDFLLIAVIVVIIIIASAYIIKQKRKGTKCIGCPYANECGSKNTKGSNCSCQTENN